MPMKSMPSCAAAMALPETEERIHRADALDGMEAMLRDRGGKRRRVRAVLVAALDRLVGNEPGVAAAAPLPAAGAPSGHVRLVLVGDADARADRAASAAAGVKWKMNSWQSFTNRSLLIGL